MTGTKIRTKRSKPLNVGISLMLFDKKEITGVLKSYVLSLPRLTVGEITKSASKKAKEQIGNSFPNYKYLGIEDVYLVVGSKTEESVLGRVTYYEHNKKSLAKSLVRNKASHSFYGEALEKKVKFYNASLVYFYKDQPSSDSFAFLIVTVVKATNYEDAKVRAKTVAHDKKFMKKIVAGASEDLKVNNIEFLGFNEISPIFDNVHKGGSYQTFYNTKVRSVEKLKEGLLTKNELQKKVSVIGKMSR